MPEINITPAPAGLPSLPPEFLRQMENATAQPLAIMQRGQDTRLNITAAAIQDAREANREKDRIQADAKRRQDEIDANARAKAAQMGISVTDKDTSETLAPKFHKFAVDAAISLHTLYQPQVLAIKKTERALQKRRDAIITGGETPEIQQQALIVALSASTKIPNSIKETALKSLQDPRNKGKSLQSVVDKTIQQISDKGIAKGFFFSNADDVIAFQQAYDAEKEKLIGPDQKLALQSVYMDLEKNSLAKRELVERIDKNALPVWTAAGKEGLSYIRNIGQELGEGATFSAHLNETMLKDAGVSKPARAAAVEEVAPAPVASAPPAPSMLPDLTGVGENKPLVSDLYSRVAPKVGPAIQTTLNNAFPVARKISEGLGAIGGILTPGSQTQQDIYQSMTGSPTAAAPTQAEIEARKRATNPAQAADAAMVMRVFKSNSIAANAPHDRIISGNPEDVQLFKAVMDKSDPTGQRSTMFQNMITNGNQHEKVVGTKLFNAVLMMVKSGIDPVSVMATDASSGQGSVPPVDDAPAILSGQKGKYPMSVR